MSPGGVLLLEGGATNIPNKDECSDTLRVATSMKSPFSSQVMLLRKR